MSRATSEELTDALTVTAPAPNPALPQQCGINVMLVLDESGSIAVVGGHREGAPRHPRVPQLAVGDRVQGFDRRLQHDRGMASRIPRGNRVGGRRRHGTRSGTIGHYFEPYLKNDYNPDGWTNWEDAFKQVAFANADDPDLPAPDDPVADLVVFMTDGDPTARNLDPPATGTKTGARRGRSRGAAARGGGG